MGGRGFLPDVMLRLGPVEVTSTVVYSLIASAVLIVFAVLVRLGLKRGRRAGRWRPSSSSSTSKASCATCSTAIRAPTRRWSSRWPCSSARRTCWAWCPGMRPPTADFSTTAALAVVVFLAVPFYGIRARGLRGYLRHYLEPSPFLLPLEIITEFSRTLALAVRLFGNIMSEELVIAVLLTIAGLLVPVPIMMLAVLTGVVQAYIFAVLTDGLPERAPCAAAARRIVRGGRLVDANTIFAVVVMVVAGLTVAIGSIGPARAQGQAVDSALDAIARQPDASDRISRTLFVGLAMIESLAIYCLVIALILLFANPFAQVVRALSHDLQLLDVSVRGVNFVVLAYVLHRLLYRPLREAIEQRREGQRQRSARPSKARQRPRRCSNACRSRLAGARAAAAGLIRTRPASRPRPSGRSLLAEAERPGPAPPGGGSARRSSGNAKRRCKSLRQEVIEPRPSTWPRRLLERGVRTHAPPAACPAPRRDPASNCPRPEREHLSSDWQSDDGAVLESAQDLDAPHAGTADRRRSSGMRRADR